MKNLMLAVFTAIITLGLNAQDIPTKVLTPELVNQNNPMTNGDSDLAKARRFVLFGIGTVPTTVRSFYTKVVRVTSFKKTHSRLGISDGTNIAPIGTPTLEYIPTGGLHYLYCLNQFSTFAPLQKEKVYIKGDVVYLPPKEEVVKEERLYDVDPQTFYTEPQFTCDDAINTWDRIQANYTRRAITRRGAKIEFNQLRYQYPNCVAGFRPVWRNDLLKGAVVVGAIVGGYYLGKSTNKGRTTTIINNPDPTVTPNGPGFIPGGTPNSGGFNGGSTTNGGRSYYNIVDAGMQQYYQGRNKSYVQPSSFAKRRNN